MSRPPALAIALVLSVTCSGCRDWQSALAPDGPQAAEIFHLLILFVGLCGFVWLLVVVVLLSSTARRRHVLEEPVIPDPAGERRLGTVIGFCVACTALIIAGLTFASYLATNSLAGPASDVLTIRLRGYQWWWEVTYLDPHPDQVITLANEIHIPVGQPVHVQLDAPDVIHSFWVPALAGKLDLIPGRPNELTIRADRPGVYRGQCAEFCGLQHAHMAFLVVADERDAFQAWRDAQLRPAPTPPDGEAAAGARIFQQKPCAACHTIRGTAAAGTLGPDLTHVASRQYIAAGMLPVTRGSLAAWIADPQTIKPGNNMPLVPLSSDELRAVSAYMASLK